MVTQSLISFGANLAERNDEMSLKFGKVVAELEETGDLAVTATSRLFRTPAWPPGNGPDFINAAIAVATSLSPRALMALLHRIEADHGRVRGRRWAPRTCDLDLLAHGSTVLPDRETVRRCMAMSDAEAASDVPADPDPAPPPAAPTRLCSGTASRHRA